MQGFLILDCIIGGQMLASVSTHLNDTLGIVIIGLMSLAVSTCPILLSEDNGHGGRPPLGYVLWLQDHPLVSISLLFEAVVCLIL